MRYLPLNDADRQAMLATIGAPSIDALYRDVPKAAWLDDAPDLPLHQGELQVDRDIRRMAKKNRAGGEGPFFCGAGVYRHHVPATVDYLIQRGEFLTAYTPYQPEVAQGTLQYLFEFQTQVALITGMEVANASVYDGSTGTTEAIAMACRVTRRSHAILDGGLHPHYAEVAETNCRFHGISLERRRLDLSSDGAFAGEIGKDVACVVVQTPDLLGRLHDLRPIAEACHAAGALLVAVVTEVMSLGAVIPPGDMGADIVVAEGQSLGNTMNFGGPHVGLFATRHKYVRQMPGRLCGETVDLDGQRGFVLTLSTREQHIRREKATSNICTNAGLCALAFTIHLSLLGEKGFTGLAELNHRMASKAADRLGEIAGIEVIPNRFFNEFAVRLPVPAAPLVERLAKDDILAGVPLSRLAPGVADDVLLVAVTETVTEEDIEALAAGLEAALAKGDV